MRARTGFAATIVAVLVLAPPVRAEDVGAIAAVEPPAEIERGAERMPAALGVAVQLGDTLRTGPGGRLRVVFRDESVINLAPDTDLAVDEQVFQPGEGKVGSVLSLLRGKVRALVSDYYESPGNSFQIETPTAVAGARGTDFIVLYDERREVTEAVGVADRIEVASPMALAGNSVLLTEREMTSVARGKLPTAPIRLDELLFRQYLEGLEFVGAGRPESIAFSSPLLDGAVPEDDLPEIVGSALPFTTAAPIPGEPIYAVPDVSTLIDQPPFAASGDPGLGIRF